MNSQTQPENLKDELTHATNPTQRNLIILNELLKHPLPSKIFNLIIYSIGFLQFLLFLILSQAFDLSLNYIASFILNLFISRFVIMLTQDLSNKTPVHTDHTHIHQALKLLRTATFTLFLNMLANTGIIAFNYYTN